VPQAATSVASFVRERLGGIFGAVPLLLEVCDYGGVATRKATRQLLISVPWRTISVDGPMAISLS
jgi:hypothetical protein